MRSTYKPVTREKPSPEWRAQAKARFARRREELKDQVEITGVFAAFAFVARADGHILPQEIAVARSYLEETVDAKLLSPSTTRLAQLPDQKLLSEIDRFISICKPRIAIRRKCVEELLHCAASDGEVNDSELEAVRVVARVFDFDIPAGERIIGRWMARYRKDFKERTRTARVEPRKVRKASAWCYKILECKPSDSHEVVRKQYRKLALKLHPDKHIGKRSGSKAHVNQASEFRRMKEAYDEICLCLKPK